jgi:uncharacterized repeat protein (TIGR01451 family)
MKTRRIMAAVAVALIALCGLAWALAWREPTTARAELWEGEDEVAALASLALPPPYLNWPEVVDAPFGIPAPTVDGYISPGEYANADKVVFPGYGGYYNEIEAFVVQDSISLYIAFDSHDTAAWPTGLGGPGPAFEVYLDPNNSKDTSPQTGDFKLRVEKGGVLDEDQGSGGGWSPSSVISWTGAVYTATWGWQAEFEIALAKLGVTPGNPVGMALAEVWTPSHPKDWYWPQGADWLQPDTWGLLVSSSDWSTFYWKPGPWEDYAPSGMPDFDQRQDQWSSGAISTHCGPVAMANSLWWFDSKFETLSGTMPYVISDTYRLVTAYGPHDDHDDQNVIPFVRDLANNYFNTNDVQGTGAWTGTYVTDMHSGTIRYLRDHGLWDDYLVTLVEKPDFGWVADEVMRSEDVILLLGFYQDLIVGPGEEWVRVGGHYVTVAGVDPVSFLIAFSDPFLDNAEATGAGRFNSGFLLLPHSPPPHPPVEHNDAGNVSHDAYSVVSTNTPGGVWGPWNYPWQAFAPYLGQAPMNPHPSIPTFGYSDLGDPDLVVEVEFALAVSPYTWKSSGYWEKGEGNPVLGIWEPWRDYAINGVPDIDQRQDNWGMAIPPAGQWQWTHCGPVAAANSLWWFDSKFEPSPVGPPQPPPPPPPSPPISGYIPYNDNYPMVWSYDMAGVWDDHDPWNVESGTAVSMPVPPVPWPPFSSAPGGELVDELAAYFHTNGILTSTIYAGTDIHNMYDGINRYLWDRIAPYNPSAPPLRQGYVITKVQSPDFWWIAEEVEHSEDVILLIGFWENTGPDEWYRLGGHYVTVPGVDKKGGLIAFSDPYYDGAGFNWPRAYPIGTPTVMGRLANGWIAQHPTFHSTDNHNDAGNLSHDVYYVTPTGSPGGVWGPRGYVEDWEHGYMRNFEGQNGPKTGGSENPDPLNIQAEVDWAIAVSPVADVWAGKTINPDTTWPGETVTITIQFGNYGSLPAEDVVLSDTLHAGLVNPSWTYWASNGLTVTRRAGTTYTWDLPDLKWMEWGIITVTAQVAPSFSWAPETTVLNVVEIETSSLEQYQILEIDNVATSTLTVQVFDVAIAKTMIPTGTLQTADWVTFTLAYTNDGTTATNVVITDALPSGLTNISCDSVGATITETGSFSYTWQVTDLAYGEGGIITVTAQITDTWPFTLPLVNTATIGASVDKNLSNNQAAVTAHMTVHRIYLPLILRNY